ncbi:MAG TPA: hypothetical protein VLA93_14780 [Pyrinomonadaceae bacterium]|nr:hypothetical protein [Pyrinomonadaceae bacterium]
MRNTILAVIVVTLVVGPSLFVAQTQDRQERLAHSNGQGTLKVGQEQFKISSVIVKLLPDRKAEITLVTDITVFLNATWSNRGDSQTEFDLEIIGGATASGLQGTGRVVLGNDGKSVAKLSLKGVSRTSKRTVQAEFEGE